MSTTHIPFSQKVSKFFARIKTKFHIMVKNIKAITFLSLKKYQTLIYTYTTANTKAYNFYIVPQATYVAYRTSQLAKTLDLNCAINDCNKCDLW